MPELRDLFRLGTPAAMVEVDHRRWSEFVETFGGTIRAIVCRRLRDCGCRTLSDEVPDIEQEVLCRLLGRSGRGPAFTIGGDHAARAYLGRVAMAVIVDRLRRDGAGKRRCEAVRSTDSITLDQYRSPEASPEERLLVRERVRRVTACCRRIAGDRNRDLKMRALRLVVFGGYRSDEVVSALDGRMTASHVDTLVSRLRCHLAAEGHALPRRNAAALERRRFRPPRARACG